MRHVSIEGERGDPSDPDYTTRVGDPTHPASVLLQTRYFFLYATVIRGRNDFEDTIKKIRDQLNLRITPTQCP